MKTFVWKNDRKVIINLNCILWQKKKLIFHTQLMAGWKDINKIHIYTHIHDTFDISINFNRPLCVLPGVPALPGTPFRPRGPGRPEIKSS